MYQGIKPKTEYNKVIAWREVKTGKIRCVCVLVHAGVKLYNFSPAVTCSLFIILRSLTHFIWDFVLYYCH